MKKDNRDYVAEAADAHSDLNIFQAIIVLLESSLNSSSTYSTASRIIDIAERERVRCLKRYDRARANIGAKEFEP